MAVVLPLGNLDTLEIVSSTLMLFFELFSNQEQLV